MELRRQEGEEHRQNGQAGIDALAELERQHSALPKTPSLRSGGGGRNHYLRWPADGVKSGANVNGLPIDVMNRVIDPSGGQDWRVAWLLTVGSLTQRVARCVDSQVSQWLVALICLAPKDEREWNASAIFIRNTEAELRARAQGKLPQFFWPSWSTRSDVPRDGFPPEPGEY